MAFLFDKGEQGYSRDLDLFKPPTIDTSIYKKEYVQYQPVGGTSKGSPIQFDIPADSGDYKDLSKTSLYVRVKIAKPGPSGLVSITADDKVAFTNLTLHSLFKQIDFKLANNSDSITNEVGQHHSMKTYIDTVLGFNCSVAELEGQMYIKETGQFFDDVDMAGGNNSSLLLRWEQTKSGEAVELQGPLGLDICKQNKLLLNNVGIKIKITPNDDPFVLITPATDVKYQFVIEECRIQMCHVKVNPGLIVAQSDAIKKSPAIYPFKKSYMITNNIKEGSYSWTVNNIFNDQVPSRLIVGLVSEKAINGSYQHNPYNFSHYNVNSIGFYIQNQSCPGEAFECNYKEHRYTLPYLSIYEGKKDVQSTSFIPKDEYPNGFCLYVFNLDEQHGDDSMSLIKTGLTSLKIKFEKPLPHAVTVVMYGQFPAILQINEARKVIF